jgi:hypothetical protein
MGSSGPDAPGIYRKPNGKYAVCWRHAGRLRFRTVGFDLVEARRPGLALIAATRGWRCRSRRGFVSRRSPAGGLSGSRRVVALTLDDICEPLHELRCGGRSAKASASAVATLPMCCASFAGRLDRRRTGRTAQARRAPRPHRRLQRVLSRSRARGLHAATG